MEFQLKQVELAIKHANGKEQLDELTSLQDSLIELITLTSETCTYEQPAQNLFDEEYALFKVEQCCARLCVCLY